MADSLWQDKDVRFDLPRINFNMRLGEKILDILNSVEDSKGNIGDLGRLVVTNLRLIWHSVTSARISLSIGWNSILLLTQKTSFIRELGEVEVIHLLTKTPDMKFEFIFTNLLPRAIKDFSSVLAIHRSYTSTRLYRELKLRGALINGHQLKVLPLEKVISNVNGVWNLSSDQGTLGNFIITNVRLVWFSDTKEQFNISIPYLHITRIKARESKFGRALVVECSECSGGYVLGFRVDPREKLEEVLKELSSLLASYTRRPIFGVEYEKEQHERNQREIAKDVSADSGFADVDVVTVQEAHKLSKSFTNYSAEGQATGKSRQPIFSKELGLAIETPPDGLSLKSLWEVIP